MTTSLDMIRGRSNVVTLTNNSGGALVAGDVCIQDTTGDEYATTTTSAASTKQVFIAAESIAGAATGKFYAAGYCPLVTPSASVTRGRYLFTHTVAKQAAENATYGAGAFGVILESGTTPSVWLFGETAQASSGTIGGSTGGTDNAIIRADGTGGSTIQNSLATVGDGGGINIPTGQTYDINGSPHTHAGGGNVTSTSAYASPPGSPASGDVWLPNDSFYILRYSGSAQVPWGPIFPLSAPPAVSGNWTWINQSTATSSETNGGIIMSFPNTASNSLRILKKAVPGGTWTITARFIPSIITWATSSYGLLFRENATGKLHTFLIGGSGAPFPGLGSIKYTNETTFSATYTSSAFGTYSPHPFNTPFYRIADDGVNRILSYSNDGVNFITFHSIGRTDFATMDEVGFFANANGAAGTIALISWSVA